MASRLLKLLAALWRNSWRAAAALAVRDEPIVLHACEPKPLPAGKP